MAAFTHLFDRRSSASSYVAKRRLQQMLVYDRVFLSPGLLEQLRAEMIQAISKHVEVDQQGTNVTLTDVNRHSCLTAQFPVLSR